MIKKSNKNLVARLRDILCRNVSRQIVSDDTLFFVTRGNVIESQGSRDALNRMDSVSTYVKVTHWFDSFWFYINIKILIGEDNATELPFVSISFFEKQGADIKQLFRAEWDNYRQDEHPQPHWHLSSEVGRQSFESLESGAEVDEDSPFAELEGKVDAVDIPKMHFAMVGNWDEGDRSNMIKRFTTEEILAQWLIKLFDHVRRELNYARKDKWA